MRAAHAGGHERSGSQPRPGEHGVAELPDIIANADVFSFVGIVKMIEGSAQHVPQHELVEDDAAMAREHCDVPGRDEQHEQRDAANQLAAQNFAPAPVRDPAHARDGERQHEPGGTFAEGRERHAEPGGEQQESAHAPFARHAESEREQEGAPGEGLQRGAQRRVCERLGGTRRLARQTTIAGRAGHQRVGHDRQARRLQPRRSRSRFRESNSQSCAPTAHERHAISSQPA